MQTVRQKKTASSSEPKLFKTNVFSRQKAMRHTFRFSKQDSGTDESRFKKLQFKKETWFQKDGFNNQNFSKWIIWVKKDF